MQAMRKLVHIIHDLGHDDGVGIDLSSDYLTNGIGISSMKERMRMLGGTFVLLSGPYMRGTKITVSVPNRRALTVSGER